MRGGETWLRFGVTGERVSRQAVEFGMALALRAARRAAGVTGGLTRAVFAHPRPADTRGHERIFAAPLEFGAAHNALVFPTSLFASRLRSADPGLRAILERHAAMILAADEPAHVEGLAPLVSRVRDAVREGLRGVQPSLDDVARKVGLSPRTLRRRLAEANTTYRQQLDDVLTARALELLAEGAGSEQIAYSLGFSDASAFRRAFKRWTGHSPSSHPSAPANGEIAAALRPALRHRRSLTHQD